MITEYLAVGAVAVALAGGSYGYIQAKQNDTLRLETAVTRGELLICGNRLNNILEDIKSDNTVDNLPDAALRVVPDHWLRVVPPATPSGD